MFTNLIHSQFHQITTLAFFPGGLGQWEMLMVGIIALLLFGKKLPEVARNLGKGFTEFKKGVSGFEDEIRSGSSDRRNIDYSGSKSSTSDNRPSPDDDEDGDEDEFAAPKFEVPDSNSSTSGDGPAEDKDEGSEKTNESAASKVEVSVD